MAFAERPNRLSRREWAKNTAKSFLILPAGLVRGYAANQKLKMRLEIRSPE